MQHGLWVMYAVCCGNSMNNTPTPNNKQQTTNKQTPGGAVSAIDKRDIVTDIT
jgi:hypothetical protein